MRTTRPAAAIAVAVLAVVGLVVSGAAAWSWLAPSEHSPEGQPVPPSAPATAPAFRESASLPPAGSAEVSRSDARPAGDREAAAAPPTRVGLPSVDVDAEVRRVGVAGDGQMQLPPSPRVMGWYRFGPAPGEGSGSVVLAGHLDSKRFGLGPLVRLRDLAVGDPVEVMTAGGATAAYRVVSLTRYDRQALPAELFARTGPERLRIITCGGEYDADRGGYQQNLVVTAVPA